jgi:hypothetical protein
MLTTTHTDCQLKVDDNCGLIFPSAVKHISGTVNIGLKNRFDSFVVTISDENSDEIARIPLEPDKSVDPFQAPFWWDLKSRSKSYVDSGSYTVSLIGRLDESTEVRCGSIECKVVDVRDVLATTRSLQQSFLVIGDAAVTVATQRLFSLYFDIIGDIERSILERLRDNKFEDPYFVACITLYFIQGIASDIRYRPKSRFIPLIQEFASKHAISAQQAQNAKFGLWAIFDFLVNYMANLEDEVRGRAMASCGQRVFTPKDKALIVSSMVSALYPYCKTMNFPKNAIGGFGEKIFEVLLKFGIKYECTQRLNKSVAICQTIQPGSHVDCLTD